MENEGDILGYPSKKIILGQSVWDIKHLNDRMHGITYMTKPSTSFNKQLLDYWGFIKEMY